MLVLVLLAILACVAVTTAVENPWATFRTPTEGPARAIGGYSRGCVAGAKRLPLTGRGYRIGRPERGRFFGHPALVDFIRDLAKGARKQRLGPLVIGDLGQPRGGPAPSGHASHQTGLDVDIWYRGKGRGKRAVALGMVDLVRMKKTRFWNKRIAGVIWLAAVDPRVDRIFVHPVIKRELCRTAKGDRRWLAKVRPWWGHHQHFHVRLSCPIDSPDCDAQGKIPPGDGCDGLDWWFRKDREEDRAQTQKDYQGRVGKLPALPDPCAALISDE